MAGFGWIVAFFLILCLALGGGPQNLHLKSPQAFAQNVPAAGPGWGAIPVHYLSANSNNSTNVKASAGTIYDVATINTTTTLYYLKLYNKAVAPTCGTDTPVWTMGVPFGNSNSGGGFIFPVSVGILFLNGIGFCLTANAADNDNTSAATGLQINIAYQ